MNLKEKYYRTRRWDLIKAPPQKNNFEVVHEDDFKNVVSKNFIRMTINGNIKIVNIPKIISRDEFVMEDRK